MVNALNEDGVTLRDVLVKYKSIDFSSEIKKLSDLRYSRNAYGDSLETESEYEANLARRINTISKAVAGISIGGLVLGAAIAPFVVDRLNPDQMQSFINDNLPKILSYAKVVGGVGVFGFASAKISSGWLNKIRGNTKIEVSAIEQEIEGIKGRNNEIDSILTGDKLDVVQKRALSTKIVDNVYIQRIHLLLLHGDIDAVSVATAVYAGREHFERLFSILENNYRSKISQNFVLTEEQRVQFEQERSRAIAIAIETASNRFLSERDIHHQRMNSRDVSYGVVEPSRAPNSSSISNVSVGSNVPVILTDKVAINRLQAPTRRISGAVVDDNPLNQGKAKAGPRYAVTGTVSVPPQNLSAEALQNIREGKPIFDGIPSAYDLKTAAYQDRAIVDAQQGLNPGNTVPGRAEYPRSK